MTDLAVIVPTFNERDNVRPMLERLCSTLDGLAWELVFVDDDSPDGTAEAVRDIARADPRVRCLQRIGRRGLSTAVVEGILSTSAPVVAVIDADLQHDETLLPEMLKMIRHHDIDLVIGSRYVQGGSVGNWSRERQAISRIASRLSRLVVKAEISDPMSGFFMIRREAFDQCVRRLSGLGFKILLDLFASAPRRLAFVELPYQFRQRLHGESKLDSQVAWEFLMLIVDKLIGHIVPVRFVFFAFVGATGVVIHFAVLWTVFRAMEVEFGWAQFAATLVAMSSNFALNNVLTYRDRRLRGLGFVRGLLSFYVICSVGVGANVGVAKYLFSQDQIWWLAGAAGILVGLVWNYAVTSIFTWRMR